MFAVTTIRIHSETSVFQNTEVNRIMTFSETEEELRNNGCSPDQIIDLTIMTKGNSKTFENTITTGIKRGTRFTYVHCLD